jgi:hypothetical protein
MANGWRRVLTVGLGATCLAGAALAGPVSVRSSPGATYFNRAGADEAALYGDLADCLDIIDGLPTVTLAVGPGLLSSGAEAVRTTANIENCMVVRRWRVVRLNDEEGAAAARLNPHDLADKLAPWIGADSPQGSVVRAFGKGRGGPSGLSDTLRAPFGDNPSLTLKSVDWDRLNGLRSKPPKQRPPKERYAKPLRAEQVAASSAGDAIALVRLKGGGGVLAFMRVGADGTAVDDGQSNVFFVKSLSERTSANATVVSIPPGRWRVVAVSGVQTCLEAPSVEFRPADVMYLGTFDIGDGVTVDMDRAPFDPLVAGSPAKDRLRPAEWVNGSRQPCSGVFIDGFALEGVREARGG